MFVNANAKINIGLSVTEQRPDGFHNIETIFFPIPLADELFIDESDAPKGTCELECEGLTINCPPEKNLVLRAYKLLAGGYDLPGIHIKLTKNIPWGAGLGGGSSDATAVLIALNKYFKLGLSENALMRYAARLGSDCPFFVKNRPVYACGTGNEMTEIPLSLEGWKVVLVQPDCVVSTAEAYVGISPKASSFDLRKLPEIAVEDWKRYVRNDFESTVFKKYPEISEAKRYLYEVGAAYASMTGSGSAVFGIFREDVVVTEVPDCEILIN